MVRKKPRCRKPKSKDLNLTVCDWCGKEIYLPFVCSYCGRRFCEEHRLPELHYCTYPRNLRYKPPLSEGDFPKKIINSKIGTPDTRKETGTLRYSSKSKTKKLLKYCPLTIITAICLYAIFTFIIIHNYPQPVKLNDVKKEIFRLINEKRIADGLPELANDTLLAITAQSWSESMAQNTKLEHGNFELRMSQIGYLYNHMCGEIIGFYSSSYELAITLVDGWINSPPHRDIMFTAKNGKMGIGLAKGNDGYYATVDFIFW